MNADQQHADQRFDNIVTVLIATVAIWVSITAYFQNYASNLSDQARRRAQQFSIEATKREINGVIQYSYEWQGAFQTWYELSLQITAAQQNGDTAAAERYQALQERIIPLSKLLSPQYFDASSLNFPNVSKFEAESYLVESTRLAEIYLAESALGNDMDNVADSLIVQITLLTVSLSLYGLSLALKGRVRWLFVAVGSGIVVFCMAWMSWSLIQLVGRSEVNEEAINAYAEGVGLSYQGRYDEAIQKFNAALEADVYYAKAYYERGNAYLAKGDLGSAIADMENARFWGMENDVSVNWNLGWTYYLSGQYAKAVEINNVVLSQRPETIGVRSNQAISYLAMGDFANAQAQYDLLIQEAQSEVSEARKRNAEPPVSLWLYMDYGALDLQSLIDTLESNPKYWTQAPPKDLIAGDHAAIRDFALEQMKRLKEAAVALEYTGQLPASSSATQIVSFEVGFITARNEEGLITAFEPAPNGVIPYGEDSFDIEFTYSGKPPQQVIWKVYINGREDQSLRKVLTQDLSAGDTWYQSFGYGYTNVFILANGEYMVELYADNKLLSSVTFYVE